MNHSIQETRKTFQTLPEDIQEAILSVEAGESINEIGSKYKLHVDQISNLGIETGYILLGLEDPMDFVGNLVRELNVDKNIASQIVTDINAKIFVPVKDSLRQIHSNAPIIRPAPEATPNIIKKVPTEELNVPQKTLDILKGQIPLAEKRPGTEILGFSSERKDITDQKMNGSVAMPKIENNILSKPVTDPYREPI